MNSAPNQKAKNFKSAFTLVELLVAIGIVGILVALTLPAINSIRESTRLTHCQNNLRQLGIACQNYHAAKRSFPLGTLGFAEQFLFDLHDGWLNPDSSYYWKRTQHTSFGVQLLPFVEQNNLFHQAESALTNTYRILAETPEYIAGRLTWFGDANGFEELASADIELFTCPSSRLSATDNDSLVVFAGSQPVNEPTRVDKNHDGFAWIVLKKGKVEGDSSGIYDDVVSHHVFCGNYLGCAGAHSGGETNDLERKRFTGVMSSRKLVSSREIGDGQSSTVLIGETIGDVKEDVLRSAQAFAFGGLARMRGAVPWMSHIHPTLWHVKPLGDSRYSSAFGFGSSHLHTCNFVFADGSVRTIRRDTDWMVLYQLTGMADGQVLDPGDF